MENNYSERFAYLLENEENREIYDLCMEAVNAYEESAYISVLTGEKIAEYTFQKLLLEYDHLNYAKNYKKIDKRIAATIYQHKNAIAEIKEKYNAPQFVIDSFGYLHRLRNAAAHSASSIADISLTGIVEALDTICRWYVTAVKPEKSVEPKADAFSAIKESDQELYDYCVSARSLVGKDNVEAAIFVKRAVDYIANKVLGLSLKEYNKKHPKATECNVGEMFVRKLMSLSYRCSDNMLFNDKIESIIDDLTIVVEWYTEWNRKTNDNTEWHEGFISSVYGEDNCDIFWVNEIYRAKHYYLNDLIVEYGKDYPQLKIKVPRKFNGKFYNNLIIKVAYQLENHEIICCRIVEVLPINSLGLKDETLVLDFIKCPFLYTSKRNNAYVNLLLAYAASHNKVYEQKLVNELDTEELLPDKSFAYTVIPNKMKYKLYLRAYKVLENVDKVIYYYDKLTYEEQDPFELLLILAGQASVIMSKGYQQNEMPLIDKLLKKCLNVLAVNKFLLKVFGELKIDFEKCIVQSLYCINYLLEKPQELVVLKYRYPKYCLSLEKQLTSSAKAMEKLQSLRPLPQGLNEIKNLTNYKKDISGFNFYLLYLASDEGPMEYEELVSSSRVANSFLSSFYQFFTGNIEQEQIVQTIKTEKGLSFDTIKNIIKGENNNTRTIYYQCKRLLYSKCKSKLFKGDNYQRDSLRSCILTYKNNEVNLKLAFLFSYFVTYNASDIDFLFKKLKDRNIWNSFIKGRDNIPYLGNLFLRTSLEQFLVGCFSYFTKFGEDIFDGPGINGLAKFLDNHGAKYVIRGIEDYIAEKVNQNKFMPMPGVNISRLRREIIREKLEVKFAEYKDYQENIVDVFKNISSSLIDANTLSSIIEELDKLLTKSYLFALDEERLQKIQVLLNRYYSYLRSDFTTFEANRDDLLVLLKDCDALLNDIKNMPTEYSINLYLELVLRIRQLSADAYNDIYVNSMPILSLQLVDSTIGEEGKRVLNLILSNHQGRREASSIRVVKINDSELGFKVSSLAGRRIQGGASQSFLVVLDDFDAPLQAMSLKFEISYSFENSERNEAESILIQTLTWERSVAFTPLTNPYSKISSSHAVRDKKMVFGRNVFLDNIVEGIDFAQPKSYVLYGQKRTGKSTILLHLQHKLEDRFGAEALVANTGEISEIYVDASTDNQSLLTTIKEKLLHAVEEKLEEDEDVLEWLASKKVVVDSLDDENIEARFNRLFKAYKRMPARKPIILLMDEFSVIYKWIIDGKLDKSFIKWWRGFLDNNEVIAIMIGQDYMPKFINLDENGFGAVEVKKVNYLSFEDACSLMDNPIALADGQSRYQEGALKKIYNLTLGSPYFTVIFCDRLVNYLNAKRLTYVTEAVVDEILNGLIHGREAFEKARFNSLYSDDGYVDADVKAEHCYKILKILAKHAVKTNNSCKEDFLIDMSCAELDLPREDVFELIKSLVERDVLEYDSGFYHINVQLFQEWLVAKG